MISLPINESTKKNQNKKSILDKKENKFINFDKKLENIMCNQNSSINNNKRFSKNNLKFFSSENNTKSFEKLFLNKEKLSDSFKNNESCAPNVKSNNYYFGEEQKKALLRLDILNHFNNDSFANYFSYQIPDKENLRLLYNKNYNINVPYSEPFRDTNLLKDESVYCIFNESIKDKYFEQKEIGQLKKNNTNLNFGDDPYLIQQEILNQNNPNKKKQLLCELHNYLGNFYLFSCRDPNFIHIGDQCDNDKDININNNIENSFYENNNININEKMKKINSNNINDVYITNLYEKSSQQKENHLKNNFLNIFNENKYEGISPYISHVEIIGQDDFNYIQNNISGHNQVPNIINDNQKFSSEEEKNIEINENMKDTLSENDEKKSNKKKTSKKKSISNLKKEINEKLNILENKTKKEKKNKESLDYSNCEKIKDNYTKDTVYFQQIKKETKRKRGGIIQENIIENNNMLQKHKRDDK